MNVSSRSLALFIATAALGFIAHLAPAQADADLGACGQIDLRAQAQCTVVPPSAQCETMCTPVSVRASCSAKLAASCDGQCSQLPSVDCNTKCTAGCKADCMLDPGKFDCKVDCQTDCDGQCAAGCSSKSNKTECMASCSGACSVSCDKQCDVQLPKADCDAECKASCDGSCKVNTNLDCQIECQAKGYVKCEADVTGGCKTRCQSKEGALFCDGNFVDTGDKLQDCVEGLKAVLDAHVMASGTSSSSCTGDACMASAKGKVSTNCSVSHLGERASAAPGFLLLGLAALLRARRRKA
jgi:hypothetical protein